MKEPKYLRNLIISISLFLCAGTMNIIPVIYFKDIFTSYLILFFYLTFLLIIIGFCVNMIPLIIYNPFESNHR